MKDPDGYMEMHHGLTIHDSEAVIFKGSKAVYQFTGNLLLLARIQSGILQDWVPIQQVLDDRYTVISAVVSFGKMYVVVKHVEAVGDYPQTAILVSDLNKYGIPEKFAAPEHASPENWIATTVFETSEGVGVVWAINPDFITMCQSAFTTYVLDEATFSLLRVKQYNFPLLYKRALFHRVGERVYAFDMETVGSVSLLSGRTNRCISFTTTDTSKEDDDMVVQSEFSMPDSQTYIFHRQQLITQNFTSKGLVQQRHNLSRGGHVPPPRLCQTTIPFLFMKPLVISTGERLYFFQGKKTTGEPTKVVYSIHASATL